MSKGISGTGEGFDAPGRRLGGFTRQPPLSSLRKTTLVSAENRKRLNSLLPSGPLRLGGDKNIMSVLSPVQAAAMAAERRLQDDIWCASVSGALEAEEEGDTDLLETVVVDEPRPARASSNASNVSGAAASRKRPQTGGIIDLSNDVNSPSLDVRDAKSSKKSCASHASSSSSSMGASVSRSTINQSAENKFSEPDTWACETCTLLNPPLALVCEACETLKPKDASVKYKFWSCNFCTLENDIVLEKCSACGEWRPLTTRLKRVSVRSAFNDFGMFLRKHTKKVTLVGSVSLALGICYLFVKLMSIPYPKVVPYSDLVTSIQSGEASKVLFEEGSRRIYFNTKLQNVEPPHSEGENPVLENSLTEDVGNEVAEAVQVTSQVRDTVVAAKGTRKKAAVPEWQYATRKVDNDESYLLGLMREKGITYSSAPQSALTSIRSVILTILTLWIPLTPLMWLLYRQLYASNGPAKKRKPSNQSVNFDDVEGVDTAKAELMEIVLCLQGAINYNKLGARLPRGVLLVGPPGTGKTLLARAVAGEAGVPFFSVSASEFVELFVGRGAARIRELFSVARKCAPSIIFIDELDAVGGKRGRSFNDERDQTLNQLLTEMDGFESDTKVIVIAATNRPEALDQALCRPGRFSRKVLVGEPDEEGRRKILAVHLRDIPLEEDKQLICNLVASLTQGLVGADLANIVNEAALLAARRGGEAVSREDIMEGVERARFGINNRQTTSSVISKELGKLFPWMPSIRGKTDSKTDGIQGPLGYQTLSS